MNNYKFEELTVGMTESFKVTITEAMLEAFKGITGDVNPLHNDEEFAKPVYIGDELTVTGEITELVESVQRLELKVTITNQDGKKVLRGTMGILVV